jgi:outer membrane protein assembly factor BamB
MSRPAKRALWAIVLLAAARLPAEPAGPAAQQVLTDAGTAAGLAVHVGTTDGTLEAGLTNSGRMLVHGLALSDEAAGKARAHLFGLRLYGLASVARVESATTLPYYDRLVNLVVADLDALGEQAPPMEEILRVLGYEGVAYVKKGGKWSKTVKPTPKEVDVWTHFAYDASRNSVSKDLLVGPPNAVRWLGGATGRNPIGGGRASDCTFVHINRAYSRGDRRKGALVLPWAPDVEGTVLWARDVNSGVLLWYRPISRGMGMNYSYAFTNAFVAAEGRVYGFDLTAADQIALTAWNLRTGAVERVFDKAVAFRKADAPAGPRKKLDWRKAAHHALQNATVLVHEGKVVLALTDKVLVMDAASGDVLWQKGVPDGALCGGALTSEDRLVLLLAKAERDGKRVPYAAVEARQLADGRPAWRLGEIEGMESPYFGRTGHWGSNHVTGGSRDQYLLIATVKDRRQTFILVDARTGKRIWETSDAVSHGFWTACILNDEVWAAGYAYGNVYDLATGKTRFKFGIPNYGTCSSHFATPNYYVHKVKAFIPIEQPRQRTRGRVRYYLRRAIAMTCAEKPCPSYGSVFQVAPVCVCEAFLPGTAALYTLKPTTPVVDGQRLSKGDAGPLGPLERQSEALKFPGGFDWGKPDGVEALLWSYMRDHGSRLGNEGRRHRPVWLGYGLAQTAPVETGQLSLVAHVHEHRLAASRGGKEVWNFVAGGRIGSAPVVHDGLAIFGCHDGYVYAVDLKDGSPAWRFLAAPADWRHVVMGQVESVWPVFNVVLHEGKLYCSAGRHPELDNGVHFYCLDPATGALQWHVKHLRGLATERLTSKRSWASTMAQSKNEPYNTDASWIINDAIAVRDGKIWLGQFEAVDLADPKDTIINAETLVPPGIGR